MPQNSIVTSIKWSSFGEIGAKLITPISSMILARLLAPDAFGVLAVCNMIISFAEILADAGFGKYIVQAEFENEKTLNKYASVAFWAHLCVALSLWGIIAINARYISEFLGIGNNYLVIQVATVQLIIMSMISTQLGLLRRKFQFKKTFIVRISTVICSLCITIPLAIVYKSFWALILGNLCGSFISMIILIFLSGWLPERFFSWMYFKNMFSFSFWSLCEGLAHWFIFWVDIFIITQSFSTYYVGLYKNSTAIMYSCIGTITAAMSPVLLSTLSRLKGSPEHSSIFISIERIFIFICMPICILIAFNREIVTEIILGGKWMEASPIIGLWAIMLGINVFIYSFPAEVFKSLGKPKYLFIYQVSFLICLIPICTISANHGFWPFVYSRAYCIILQVFLFMLFAKLYLKWDIKWLFNELSSSIIASTGFFILCWILIRPEYSLFGHIISSAIAIVIYIIGCRISFFKTIKSSIIFIMSKRF